jgi:hypothetical protein
MDALRKSIGGGAARQQPSEKPVKKSKKTAPGQKGNADADRRQEAGQGGLGEKAGQASEEVGLATTMASRRKAPRSSCFESAPPVLTSCSSIWRDKGNVPEASEEPDRRRRSAVVSPSAQIRLVPGLQCSI